jgi:hypothetical protein
MSFVAAKPRWGRRPSAISPGRARHSVRAEEQFIPKVLGTLLREILQHYPLAEFAEVIGKGSVLEF